MKRFFALLAMLLLLLSACAGQEQGDEDGDDAPAAEYGDALIGALYSEAGDYTDAAGNTLHYDYAVPRILSETAVAAALNQEIANRFGATVEEQKSMMAAGASLSCRRIAWQSHWSGSLLCLVIESTMDDGYTSYDVYSYDFFGGKRLTSGDLAARCGLSGEDFLAAARRTLARAFDERWSEALSEGGASFAARYAERRAWTLSDENVNEQTAAYLDGGVLYLVAPMGTFAGADSEQVLLPLDTSLPDGAELRAEDRFVRAVLCGDTLRVWFEETDEAARFAEEFGFAVEVAGTAAQDEEEFGSSVERAFFVEGLYADYTAVFIGSIGQGYFPYLFLLTEEGRVEYVNLLEGMTAGFLCDGGVLGGVSGIVSFESGTVEAEFGGYETVFAVDASGGRHDLYGAVSDADWVLAEEFLGTWSAEIAHDTADEPYTSDAVLTLTDGGGITVVDIRSGLGIYNELVGQINYLGTNGEGMVYSYHLNERTGSVRCGAVTLLRQDETLRVKTVAGEELFDAPSGRATEFTWSF